MPTVLAIDDNPAVLAALDALFRLNRIRFVAANTPEEGLRVVARELIDVAIVDMNFSADTTSGEEGVALFRELRTQHPDLPVILFTAWTNLEAAVQLVKAGAADYIAKPWDNNKLLTTVGNLIELAESARERQRMQCALRRRREQIAEQYDLRGVVFESLEMERAVELACRVARSTALVLITGPNGAGKERIAEIVHANSAVSAGPFIAVNCGALPAELIEAELFGVQAGAFTGANRTRGGRFEAAEGGTLFLDEIANLPLAGQVKLLRVLECGSYEPLGTNQARTAHVRVISATNADLHALIQEGRFREDLFYRLNVIEIAVPALAERPEDILPLAERFLGDGLRLSSEARSALVKHNWPGNVRELRNAIERAKLLARDDVINFADLNLPQPPAANSGASRSLDDLTRAEIEKSLRDSQGHIGRAARRLGISRQSLYRRMERHGIHPAR